MALALALGHLVGQPLEIGSGSRRQAMRRATVWYSG